MKKNFKERINYVIDGVYYVGYMVNMPSVVVQARSKEEMVRKAKVAVKMWLNFMSETINRDDPFETVEFSKEDWNKV